MAFASITSQSQTEASLSWSLNTTKSQRHCLKRFRNSTLGRTCIYSYCRHHISLWSGKRFKHIYEHWNRRALEIVTLYEIQIFQYKGEIFCMEYQRFPLKFHTKYHINTLKYDNFIQCWKFKSFQNWELIKSMHRLAWETELSGKITILHNKFRLQSNTIA